MSQAAPRDRSGAGPYVTCRLANSPSPALQDGVALADGRGRLAMANLRLEEMFGYGHGELIGHPVETLIPRPRRTCRAALPVRASPKPSGTSTTRSARSATPNSLPAAMTPGPCNYRRAQPLSPTRFPGELQVAGHLRPPGLPPRTSLAYRADELTAGCEHGFWRSYW